MIRATLDDIFFDRGQAIQKSQLIRHCIDIAKEGDKTPGFIGGEDYTFVSKAHGFMVKYTNLTKPGEDGQEIGVTFGDKSVFCATSQKKDQSPTKFSVQDNGETYIVGCYLTEGNWETLIHAGAQLLTTTMLQELAKNYGIKGGSK